jgi:hypothetical protein
MEWYHTALPKKKKTRTMPSAGKNYGKFSRMPWGAYWLIFCPERKLSVQFDIEPLQKLQHALCNKHPMKRYHS